LNTKEDLGINSKNAEMDNDIDTFLDKFKSEYHIEPKELIKIIEKRIEHKGDILIPASIFTKDLGIIEAVVKYLKEEKHMRIRDIAKILNRSKTSIWVSYNQSRKKFSARLTITKSELIPVSIFSDRKLGPLQVLSRYMRKDCGMTYSQISKILQRDQRTIWISCNKA